LRFERVVEGTCDCCLVEWLLRSCMVPDECVEEEPDDIDGEEPDMLPDPDDDCAKAVPATSRAAAAVTINVRMENPLRGWYGAPRALYPNFRRAALFRDH